MPLDAKMVKECCEEYSNSHDRLTKLYLLVVSLLEGELKKRNVMARVAGRAKSVDSLRGKLTKWSQEKKKAALFKARSDVFNCVGDLAGVRVMTYTEHDRELVYKLVKEIFANPVGKTDFDTERKEESARVKHDKSNFYRATHMQVCLRPEHLTEGFSNLKGVHCEIQITSMLAHVWNEIEHDMRYKGDSRSLSDDEVLMLDSLGLLTESGDHIISSLINANARRVEAQRQQEILSKGRIKDVRALTEALEDHFGPTVSGKTLNYRLNADALWDTVEALKLTQPQELFQFLSPALLQNTVKKTMPAFVRHLKATQQLRPKLVVESCDLFLIALLKRSHATIAGLPKTNRGPAKRHLFFAGAFVDFEASQEV
jgi:ppGpp synthetase/RelA/SpoT-type nucleotidyltranferase